MLYCCRKLWNTNEARSPMKPIKLAFHAHALSCLWTIYTTKIFTTSLVALLCPPLFFSPLCDRQFEITLTFHIPFYSQSPTKGKQVSDFSSKNFSSFKPRISFLNFRYSNLINLSRTSKERVSVESFDSKRNTLAKQRHRSKTKIVNCWA